MFNKKIHLSTFIIAAYLIIIVIYYVFFIANYFDVDTPNYILDADSFTYIQLNHLYSDLTVLLGLNLNTFGPLIILRLVNGSVLLIFLINITVFLLSYRVIITTYRVNNKMFIFLLILNPLLFPVLTTLNKEIFGLASVSYMLAYLKTQTKSLLYFSLAFAILCRWQLTFVVIFFFIFCYFIKLFRVSKTTGIIVFVLTISILYPIFFNEAISNLVDANTVEQQQATAGPVINALNYLQSHFLYFLAVIPKVFFNLIGNVTRVFVIPFRLLAGEKDIYNNVFLIGHQVMSLIVISLLTLKRKLYNNKKLLLFCVLYCIVFSLGPLIQYRYLFPIYVAFCVMVCEYRIVVQLSESNHQSNILKTYIA